MQFKPSAYSDATTLSTATPTTMSTATSSTPAFDASTTTAAIQAGTALFSVGADIYSQERARAEAEKARKAQRKRKKKRSAQTLTATAPVPAVPAVAAASGGMPGWAKWGLGIAGVAVLGFVAWKMLGGKEEHAPAPRRSFVAPKRNPAPKLKPVKPAPASSASMFRDEKTERLIDAAVEEAHGDDYEAEPADFNMGDAEE